MEWADRTRAQGHLKGGNKLTDDAGKIMKSQSNRSLTDGPYAEQGIVAGFFLTPPATTPGLPHRRGCPHLKYGSHIEVRQSGAVSPPRQTRGWTLPGARPGTSAPGSRVCSGRRGSADRGCRRMPSARP
jgi:hypothetical protein